jgi:hypothetical protein
MDENGLTYFPRPPLTVQRTRRLTVRKVYTGCTRVTNEPEQPTPRAGIVGAGVYPRAYDWGPSERARNRGPAPKTI